MQLINDSSMCHRYSYLGYEQFYRISVTVRTYQNHINLNSTSFILSNNHWLSHYYSIITEAGLVFFLNIKR